MTTACVIREFVNSLISERSCASREINFFNLKSRRFLKDIHIFLISQISIIRYPTKAFVNNERLYLFCSDVNSLMSWIILRIIFILKINNKYFFWRMYIISESDRKNRKTANFSCNEANWVDLLKKTVSK